MNVLLGLIVSLAAVHSTLGNFIEGDIVSTSRRGQYHASRTTWHDLMGRHCPRFATETKVAVPIPKPVALQSGPLKYKIQFVFNDRLYSPWIQIIGKGSVGVPIVWIELEHIANMLKAVKAEVVPVNQEYIREHQQILREFQNATLWPKHLLVHYTWKHTNPINVNGGLYLVFLVGILATGILGVSVTFSYQEKLKAFIADMASDEGAENSSRTHAGTSWQKSD